MPVIPKKLQQVIKLTGVVASPQLVRRDWLSPVSRSNWAHDSMTVTTRSKQGHSVVTLEWYAPDWRTLNADTKVLLHDSCLTELLLLDGVIPQESVMRRVSGGLKGMAWPDAEALWRNRSHLDTAIEIDTGYDWPTTSRKIASFGAQGYESVIWATTVHQRTRTWGDRIVRMVQQGELDRLRCLKLVYINVWSERDTYVTRPRCNKPMRRTLTFANRRVTSDMDE